MSSLKNTVLKSSYHWHQWLGWLGGFALLLFAISGIFHPVMSWTGPKAAAFFPPQIALAAEKTAAIPTILQRHNLNHAIMVKVVPAEKGALLQVTTSQTQPRRYFDLSTGEELLNQDQQQALWLARYYTGFTDTEVTSIRYQTEFDNAYPWVNRLLPVYRIEFANNDRRIAYIYTELSALAGMSNPWRTTLQTAFRAMHTLNWLDHLEYGRVILMLIFLGALFALVALGVALLLLIRNRKQDAKRRWHRVLSYIICVPLLLYTISGTYHLLFYAFAEQARGLQLGENISLAPERFGNRLDALLTYQGIKLNGVSVVEGPDQQLYYRLSIPQGRPGQSISRQQRFNGVPIEKPALYINALTGQESSLNDAAMATHHGSKLTGFSKDQITDLVLVTHFGPLYDFRNKRLPVWQIDYQSQQGDKIFVDPANGMLVDRLTDNARYESYSFSFLHKWNFLRPLIGPQPRDVLIIAVLGLAIISTFIGFLMLTRKKQTVRR